VLDDGARSLVLGCGFERIDDDHLRITTPAVTVDISP
jgi:hypothetical protein